MIRDAATLEKALVELGSKAGATVLRGALRDAAKPIQKRARANIQRKTGESRRNIKIKAISGKGIRSDVATVLIGGINRAAYKLKFIEKGTKKHGIPNETVGRGKAKRKNKAKVAFGGKVYSKVNHPGTKAKPFLKPAFDVEHKNALKIFSQRVYERLIVATVKKYGR